MVLSHLENVIHSSQSVHKHLLSHIFGRFNSLVNQFVLNIHLYLSYLVFESSIHSSESVHPKGSSPSLSLVNLESLIQCSQLVLLNKPNSHSYCFDSFL